MIVVKTTLRDGHLGIPNPERLASWMIRIQNANLNQVIGFSLDLPQHQRCTWFYHMKVNVHKQTFFQSIHMCFSVTSVKTRALLRMHRHFFSPFMCVFLIAPYGNSTKYIHTDIFSVHSLCFSCTTWASRNSALLYIHWHFAVHHISFLKHECAQWFLQLLHQLHAFVSHWVHCFVHVVKSVVVVLLTCQLEKHLEREKLRMSNCLCLHKWLETILV